MSYQNAYLLESSGNSILVFWAVVILRIFWWQLYDGQYWTWSYTVWSFRCQGRWAKKTGAAEEGRPASSGSWGWRIMGVDGASKENHKLRSTPDWWTRTEGRWSEAAPAERSIKWERVVEPKGGGSRRRRTAMMSWEGQLLQEVVRERERERERRKEREIDGLSKKLLRLELRLLQLGRDLTRQGQSRFAPARRR